MEICAQHWQSAQIPSHYLDFSSVSDLPAEASAGRSREWPFRKLVKTGHWDVASFWWNPGPTLAKVLLASFIACISSPLNVKTTRSWKLGKLLIFSGKKQTKAWYNLNACWLQGPTSAVPTKWLLFSDSSLILAQKSNSSTPKVQHQLKKNRHCLAIGTRRSIMGLNSTSLGALGNGILVESGEASQTFSLQD